MLTPEQILALQAQAQEQAGSQGTPATTVTNTQTTVIKEGEIIEPKTPEYKTPEQLREEAEALALETEKLQEITELESKLNDDATTEEEKVEIKAKLKELQPEDIKQEENKTETAEEKIARLERELEEAKNGKKTEENPLAKVEAKAKENGVDIPKYYEEYVNNGELSAESLQSLLNAGFDEVAVNAYINTKISQAQAEADSIINSVAGNRENFDAMTKWMQDTLSADELAKYNAGVHTEHAKIYVENMYAKYTKATTTPVVIRSNGQQTGTQTNLGFKSLNEQNMAMADPRYGNDTKYTTEVRNKVLNSKF